LTEQWACLLEVALECIELLLIQGKLFHAGRLRLLLALALRHSLLSLHSEPLRFHQGRSQDGFCEMRRFPLRLRTRSNARITSMPIISIASLRPANPYMMISCNEKKGLERLTMR
jgi:hypothetical protein